MKEILIAGNPNSGKTTFFNYVTGSKAKTGNWSGVTVDLKKEFIKPKYVNNRKDVLLVDIPGTYTMDSLSKDENVAVDYINKKTADCIINIVEAKTYERALVFTKQLIATGIPVVVVLNKFDVIDKKKINFKIDEYEKLVKCPVFTASAKKKQGIEEVISYCLNNF